MKIKVINKSKHELPGYSTEAAAGMDLRANLDQDIVIKPMERIMVPTGLFLEIPVGYEAQISPEAVWLSGKELQFLIRPEQLMQITGEKYVLFL